MNLKSFEVGQADGVWHLTAARCEAASSSDPLPVSVCTKLQVSDYNTPSQAAESSGLQYSTVSH